MSNHSLKKIAWNESPIQVESAVRDGAGKEIASTYLEKIGYEYNKEINFGSSGYLKIGSFAMYDTNITIDIDSTTSTTYHGTVIIATQNVSESNIGSAHVVSVYGDASDTITSSIRVVWTNGSRNYDIYFVPPAWSKNFVHIRAMGLYAVPTDVCVTVEGTAPSSTSGLEAVNVLKNNFLPSSTNYVSSVNGSSGAITNVAKTNADNNFSASQTMAGADVSSGVLKVNVLHAKTSSSSTTYGPGSSTNVLKSNGTNCYWGTDSNNTTDQGIGANYKAKNAYGGYSVLIANNENKLVPTVSGSGYSNGTSKTMNTESFNPFGLIAYTNSSSNRSAGDSCSSSTWIAFSSFDLRYSFNCGSTLTANVAVYIVAEMQSDGQAKLASPYYTQTLPSTADGKIYIYLGQAISTTNINLQEHHPVYQYMNGAIRLFTRTDLATTSDLNNYQPLNTNLTGISAMTQSGPGLLKRTISGGQAVWGLDTSSYAKTNVNNNFSVSQNISGDMIANYVAIQSAGHETGTYDKVLTLSSTNYVRYRTKSEMASDLGVPGSTKGITYIDGDTNPPSSANTDGGLIIVVMSSEPATKYDGYIYLITE